VRVVSKRCGSIGNSSIRDSKSSRARQSHDWSSHAADAFRGLAVRHKSPEAPRPHDYEYEYSYRMPHPLDWMDA
jgi:hypothetical protein